MKKVIGFAFLLMALIVLIGCMVTLFILAPSEDITWFTSGVAYAALIIATGRAMYESAKAIKAKMNRGNL